MNNILLSLPKKSLTDIYQIGLVINDLSVFELIPSYDVFFLEFDESVIIKLELTEHSNQICINELTEITVKDYIDLEEGYPPYKTSLRDLVLNGTHLQNTINSINVFGFAEQNDNTIVCDAIEFTLDNGQEMFFDPFCFHGITIGGKGQKNLWLEKHPRKLEVKTIK